MLLDTASLYYRAFYGVPETLAAPDGTPVNAIRGLLDMIARLVRARHPGRLVACLDADWRPAFRVTAIPSYKAHRARPDGTEEDLFQLVDDARQVSVIYTVRGLARIEVVDEGSVSERYNIPGRAYADFAALRGDPSDGLPGVPGVGDKTAAALIRTFGTIDAITTALDMGHGGFPTGSRPKVAAARDYLAAALPVVRVATDAPLPPIDGRLPAPPADPGRLDALDERWDLGSSLRRACTTLAGL
jgi:5'-3' exonuclease